MKKVLIITYYWPPSGGGGVQRWVKFVKYLPLYNVQPVVLTVDSAHASYPLLDDTLYRDVEAALEVVRTKSFEPLSLYGKLSSNKEIPYGGFANEEKPGVFKKFARFIRGNFFIPDARIGWNRYAWRKAVEIINKHKIDTIITSSPPHSTQLIGLKLKKQFGINWIADMRDPWTDIYYYSKMYHTSLVRKIDRKKELSVLKNADNVIVVSNSIKKLFSDKLTDESSDKIVVIPNGYDDTDFSGSVKKKDNRFTITYTGTIADNYNIEGAINAFSRFIADNERAKINIRFVGHVSQKYRKLINDSSINEFCTYIDHVEHDKSVHYLQNSDVLFLAIPDVPHNEGILTGKLFEYLAAGKKIIAVGPVNGDAAGIISECNAGKTFEYNDENGILNYIDELYNNSLTEKYSDVVNEKVKNYARINLTKKLKELL